MRTVYMSKTPKRKKTKYPALSKGMNLRSRKDYIEPDYINGVRNEHGEIVIRPMTDKEKKFLNDFYSESIITDFLHDPRLKKLLAKKRELINDDIIEALNEEVKQLKQEEEPDEKRILELKQIVKITKNQNRDTFKEELAEIEKQMQEVRDEVLLYPKKEDHKKFYNDNNSRNSCIYTRATSMSKMTQLAPEDYDVFCNRIHGLYGNPDVDLEEALINELERAYYEEEEERLEFVKNEEKSKKKA